MEHVSPIVNACVDLPRETDWKFGAVAGASIYPNRTENRRAPVQDQSLPRVPKSDYMCTCFGMSHVIDEENLIEAEEMEVPNETLPSVAGETLGEKAIPFGLDVDSGWSLQGALDLARKLGYIEGYSVVSNVDEAKAAIANGSLLYTGTNRCEWSGTAKDGIFQPMPSGQQSYGHAFCIVDYDEDWFYAKQSYGPGWGPLGGYFRISVTDAFSNLYTKYAIHDKKDSGLILNYRRKMDEATLKELVNFGVTNGLDQEKPITRREAMLMVGRALSIAHPDFRAAIANDLNPT